jgi:hypothetical protein
MNIGIILIILVCIQKVVTLWITPKCTVSLHFSADLKLYETESNHGFAIKNYSPYKNHKDKNSYFGRNSFIRLSKNVQLSQIGLVIINASLMLPFSTLKKLINFVLNQKLNSTLYVIVSFLLIVTLMISQNKKILITVSPLKKMYLSKTETIIQEIKNQLTTSSNIMLSSIQKWFKTIQTRLFSTKLPNKLYPLTIEKIDKLGNKENIEKSLVSTLESELLFDSVIDDVYSSTNNNNNNDDDDLVVKDEEYSIFSEIRLDSNDKISYNRIDETDLDLITSLPINNDAIVVAEPNVSAVDSYQLTFNDLQQSNIPTTASISSSLSLFSSHFNSSSSYESNKEAYDSLTSIQNLLKSNTSIDEVMEKMKMSLNDPEKNSILTIATAGFFGLGLGGPVGGFLSATVVASYLSQKNKFIDIPIPIPNTNIDKGTDDIIK